MRICVLSNSHAASLQGAVEAVQKDTGDVFTIFAAPNRGMKQVKLDADKKRLVPSKDGIEDFFRLTSEGLQHIEIADYDAFLLHGLFIQPPRFDKRHSQALRAEVAKEILGTSEATSLAQKVREATSVPILVSPEPLPADFEEDDETTVRIDANAPQNPSDLAEVWQVLSDNFPLSDVNWLWQDPSTIGTRMNTKRSYSTGSQRVQVTAKEDHNLRDVRHMNAKYGDVVLRMASARLKSMA